MIKVKLGEVISAIESLKILGTVSLKGKTAYQIARLLRETENEYKLYEEERKKLVEKYAARDANNELIANEAGDISVDTNEKNKLKGFREELNELLDNEVELNVDKIELKDLENNEFSPQIIKNLIEFIKE